MWVPFALGALHSIFIGLGYAEMASMFPKAGAGYVYIERGIETITPKHAKFVSFIIASNIVFVAIPLGTGAVALAFGAYLATLLNLHPTLAAILCVIVLSIINWFGVKESGRTAAIITVVEASGLALVMILGAFFGSASPDYLAPPPTGLVGMIEAFAMILFTYSGYEAIVSLSEEIKNPEKTIPKALLMSVFAVGLTYVGVSLLITRLAPLEVIAGSASPMVSAVERVLGGITSPLFAFIGCFATLNTVLAWLVGNSRMMYGMADEGVLPHALTLIDRRRHTPWVTVLVMMLITILSTLIGEIQLLVFSNMIASLSLTILGSVSLILLRMRAPQRKRPFRVPLSIRNIPIPIVAALLVNVLIVSLLPPLSWVPFLTVTALAALFYPILRQKNR